MLDSEDDAVRAAVEDALLRSDPALVRAVVEEKVRSVASATRVSSARLLARLDPGRCDRLAGLLADPDAEVRREAARGLAVCHPEGVRGQLLEALGRERESETLAALIRAVGAAGGAEAVAALHERLEGASVGERFAIARALGRTRSKAALSPLLRLMDDPAESVRHAALIGLGELGDPRGAEPVGRRLEESDRELRRTAATALQSMASDAARERLLDALTDEDWQVRLCAVRALRIAGGAGEAERLRAVARQDPDPLVRKEAAGAIAGAD